VEYKFHGYQPHDQDPKPITEAGSRVFTYFLTESTARFASNDDKRHAIHRGPDVKSYIHYVLGDSLTASALFGSVLQHAENQGPLTTSLISSRNDPQILVFPGLTIQGAGFGFWELGKVSSSFFDPDVARRITANFASDLKVDLLVVCCHPDDCRAGMLGP
jgi:hypothetical protein